MHLKHFYLRLPFTVFLALSMVLPAWAQFKLDIHNEVDYQRTKGKFPDAKLVDLYRHTTVRVGKAPSSSKDAFVWELEDDFERISTSNERVIPYYIGVTDFDEVEKAFFWRKDGKKLETWRVPPTIIPVERNGIFHDDYRIHGYGLAIENPGAVLKGNIKSRVLSIPHGTTYSFFEGVPAEEVKLSFEVPDWLKVRFERINFEGYTIEEEKVTKGKTVIYSFTMRDLPGKVEEKWSPGAQHYLPMLLLVPEAMFDPKSKRNIKLFEEAADIYAWSKELADQADDRPEKLRPLVSELTTGKSEVEKLEAIYYWVQNNIRYLAYEDGWAGFIPDACQNVYEKRYGDCKGMANLLKEMLLLAGFDARLVWIGTREYSPLSKKIPVISSSNHMVAAVRFNGQWLILDGTASQQPLLEVPDNLQGQEVFIEGKSKKDFEIYTIPRQAARTNAVKNVFDLTVDLKEGHLVGNQRQTLTGYPRSGFRSFYLKTALKDRQRLLEEYMSSGQLYKGFKDLQADIPENLSSPVSLSAAVVFQGQATMLDNEVYLPSSIYNRLKNLQLPEKRDAAVSFDYKRYIVDTLRYTLPEGYVISFLPKTVDLKRDKYHFYGHALDKGQEVEIVYILELSDFIIKKQEFESWNEDVKQMKAFLTDQVILKRK